MCQEKQCTKCLRFLPLGEFYKDNGKKDGHKSQCKQCLAKVVRKRYAVIKDKHAESQRKYYAANKEKVAAYNRKYYAANRDKLAERHRKWSASTRAETAQTAVFRGLDKNKLNELKTKLEKLEK